MTLAFVSFLGSGHVSMEIQQKHFFFHKKHSSVTPCSFCQTFQPKSYFNCRLSTAIFPGNCYLLDKQEGIYKRY